MPYKLGVRLYGLGELIPSTDREGSLIYTGRVGPVFPKSVLPGRFGASPASSSSGVLFPLMRPRIGTSRRDLSILPLDVAIPVLRHRSDAFVSKNPSKHHPPPGHPSYTCYWGISPPGHPSYTCHLGFLAP